MPYTPGPWKLVGEQQVGIPITESEEGAYGWIDMLEVYGYYLPDVPVSTQSANARLIAAAPDLLGALKELVYAVTSTTPPKEYNTLARAIEQACNLLEKL